MNSWDPQCDHSKKLYKQLYDFDHQSGPVKVDASGAHIESQGKQVIYISNTQMSTPLSLDERIKLLQNIVDFNWKCAGCVLDIKQRAIDWLRSPECNLTERAILYLVTAYKIQKRCNGDLAALKEKLEEAFNTCKLQRENNLLHHFISYGYLPVVKYLLKQKEAPSWLEQKNTEGRLPIHIAIMTGNSEITDLLIPLSSAELLNTQDTQGNTPLHLAVKQAIKSKTDREEFESVIEVLLKQGANPNSVNFKEKKPLDLAVGSAKAERISSIFHQTCLHDVKPESALAQLCVAFRQLNPNEEIQIQECYASLFNLLSHLTSLDLLENNLLNLLDKSAFLTKEQEQLALLLGKWYLKKEDLKKAMLCFAKALQMNRSQGNYSTASQVFFHYFEMHKEEHLERFFENSVPSLETMTSYVETIKSFKAFGIPKESLIPFFTKIANGISKIPPETQKKFENYEKDVEALQNSPWKLEKTPIERYWNALQTFRSCFTNQDDVQTIQKEAFDAMKQLIEFCIKDTQILIGPPPCHYDLRAMGSFGRKEMCPYSSLDCMLLIEDETAFPYFERMLELLELQIASLGETQGLPFVFTCISNPLKFHLNESPLKYKELSKAEEDKELLKTSKYKELIGTSEQMAQLQKRKPYSKNGIEYSALKTISLNQSSCQLYSDYEKCLQEIRKDISLPLFDLCKQNVRDFSRVWKHHFDRSVFTQNIKENFVKTLYYPLSDLAVYLKIESTNILEIADALIDRKVLPEKMRDLLKESISLIYQIRVRNHLHYTTQEEKVNLISSEIATLEKCYWQILIPLHTCLKKITDARKPHHQYFEKLCQTYDPQGLTKQLRGAASILDAVLHLPDSSTTRPIYTVKMDALQASITAITSPLFPSVSEEISVQIKTPYFPIPRSLWPSLTKKIMEGLDLKQSYTNSAHRVCRLQYGIYDLHFKQTPSNPLMEYAIHSFASRIAGEYTPCTTLVRFDVEQQGKKKSYPVLISQTIPGKNLKTVWPKATPNRSYTWNLLIAILTKPQDGRLSNYVLHEQDLFCIDNDLAFVEPVTKFGPFRTVHFSAAPFCLFPLSTPLDQEVLEEFIALDSVSICKAWVEEIINKEKEYVDLFTESERKDLYEKQQCTLNLLLQKGTFSTLNLQFWQLQNTIQAAINQDKAFTAGDLLQELVSLTEEKVGNYVYRAYNNTKATPEEKQQTALERKQDSSVTAVEYHKNCLGKIPCFNETGVLKKYSLQEASQELFHAFLIESEHTFWKNSAGKSALGANFKALQNPKREAKILLSINELIKRSSQKVLSLSFYYSTLLDKRKIEFLLHSALEKVDLRHCSNVDNDTVWLIQEKCPHLKELILIECPKVTDLGEPLLSSRLSFNNLETLEITHTPCINLAFRAPKLRFLNVSHNPELVDLDFEAPSLLEINAKKSTKIRLSPLAKKHTLEALAQIPKNLVTAPFELINNRQIVTDIILQNGLVLEHATIQFKKDKEIVLAAVQQNGLAFQYAAQELKSDRDIVFTAVKRSGLALQYAAEELKNDKEIVLIAVKENELAFEYASEKLKSDREFVLAAIQQNGRALEYAAEELKSDQKFMLAAVQWHGYALQYASETLKNDRKIVLAAVRQNGKAFQYAAKQLKNDREFILIAIKQSCEAFQYASVELKSDKEFMLAAMNQESNVLQYTSEELKSDRDIVLAGVQKNGLALQYAIEEFKSDRKIVLAAVQKNRLALEYAAEEVKSDRDIVLAAVQKNGLALESASKGLKSDKEFMLAAMQENRYALEYASEELKNDRDFMLGACLLKGEALQFASKELKSDKEFMLAAVKKNGLNLQYASAEFKSDREVVLAAMRQNGEALEYTSAEFKSDREIVLAAVMQNPQVFSYASKNLKSDQKFVLDATLESKTLKFNKKFMVVAVQENGYALEYASETLKSNKQLVLTAVQQNGLALQYAAEELKSDREIVLAAVQQNGLALQYAAEELKSDREIALAAVQKNRLAIEDVSKALKSDGKFMLSAALQNKEAFQYAAEELKSDKGFILAAVKQDGNALQYAAEELKSDREIVLAAVEQNGLALQYAAKELESDREIVLAAVQQNGLALQYAADELKSDRAFMLVLAANRDAPKYATGELESDREIILAALQENGLALKYASENLKNDREVVLAAVKKNARAIEYASPELTNNREIVLAAVQQFAWGLYYASEELKSDKEFILAAMQKNQYVLPYASEKLKSDKAFMLVLAANGYGLQYAIEELESDKEIILAAVQQNSLALKYASPELKNDREIVLTAVQKNGLALQFASEALKIDREVALVAVQQNGLALEYVSEELKKDKEIVLAAVQQNRQAISFASEELNRDKSIMLAAGSYLI